MLSVLATGTIAAEPKARTSAAGKPFATALLRVPSDDAEAMLVSVIAFDTDAVAALLALAKGDTCAIAGKAKLSTWTKDGEPKHGLSVVAERVLSAYAVGKSRKAVNAQRSGARSEQQPQSSDAVEF